MPIPPTPANLARQASQNDSYTPETILYSRIDEEMPMIPGRNSSIESFSFAQRSGLTPTSSNGSHSSRDSLVTPHFVSSKAEKMLGMGDLPSQQTRARKNSLDSIFNNGVKGAPGSRLSSTTDSPLRTQAPETYVGMITNATVAGFLHKSIPGLLGRRLKRRFFMLTPNRIMYFKSNTVDSKLVGSMKIDTRTVITFPRSAPQKESHMMQLSRAEEEGDNKAVLQLVFDTHESMKGWRRGIESAIRIQQTMAKRLQPDPAPRHPMQEQPEQGIRVIKSSGQRASYMQAPRQRASHIQVPGQSLSPVSPEPYLSQEIGSPGSPEVVFSHRLSPRIQESFPASPNLGYRSPHIEAYSIETVEPRQFTRIPVISATSPSVRDRGLTERDLMMSAMDRLEQDLRK